MRNKGVIIAVLITAVLLLVSAGIALAAGLSGEGDEARQGTLGAEDATTFRYRNAGEESEARNMNNVGQEDGECAGDCDRDRDCDKLQDGSCDGECNGNGPGAALSTDADGVGRQGECAGDCSRDQLGLRDQSCDGSRDGSGKQK